MRSKQDLTRVTGQCQNPQCREYDVLDENGLCERCTPEDLDYEHHPFQPARIDDLTDCEDE
jgi:hypothetical protein